MKEHSPALVATSIVGGSVTFTGVLVASAFLVGPWTFVWFLPVLWLIIYKAAQANG